MFIFDLDRIGIGTKFDGVDSMRDTPVLPRQNHSTTIRKVKKKPGRPEDLSGMEQFEIKTQFLAQTAFGNDRRFGGKWKSGHGQGGKQGDMQAEHHQNQ